MTRPGTLRSRLFVAIAAIAAISIGVSLGVGLVLTRRAVKQATLTGLTNQAALIAAGQRAAIAPLAHVEELVRPLARQHERYTLDISLLPKHAIVDVQAGRPAHGTLVDAGTSYYFAAQPIGKQTFVLLRPTSLASANWRPFLEGLLIAALVGAERSPRLLPCCSRG